MPDRTVTERIHFGSIKEAIEPPNLIEVQLNSYVDFLQKDVPANKRKNTGLQTVFKEVFPIESYDEKATLDFSHYEIGEPKLSALEAQREGQTYSAPLHVTFQLKEEKGTKEEKVYMGEIPLMTPSGTFVINGAERVVVSQLHRSPGIAFESSIHLNGKVLYSFRIIPDRGSWIEVQFDTSDLLYIYLDRRKRRRKFLATTFLRALGYGPDEEVIKLFYNIEDLKLSEKLDEESLAMKVLTADVLDGEVTVARAFEPLTLAVVRSLMSEPLNMKSVKVIDITNDDTVVKALKKDPAHDQEEALKDIYRKLRPGDPPTVANARALLKRLFFDPKKYDLGRVGRYKLNQKLGIDVDLSERILTDKDFIAAIKYLINLRRGEGTLDDIDHLGSRRVRTVGELLANQCRVGLARTERLVKERMTLFDVNIDGMTPQKLINPKALSAVVRDFFGRSQLSQFMDQTNPLAELTHKRRLSALGPGGLSRDRAGFEVRDVHPSHYGRICPIETPEGPNIGLISSMSTFARINEFGFIETPYRKVDKGRVSDQVDYLTGDREEAFIVAQANAPMDEKGHFTGEKVSVRYRGDFLEAEPNKVNEMNVSPKQLVSVAAGLIPFLEHDDANRALMGSNMQRQGVPLIVSESPLVGTGLEGKVARDSRAVVVSTEAGRVASVTADQIVVTKDGEMPESRKKLKTDEEAGVHVYELRKFMRSNAGTCVNQKPIVKKGQHVKRGQVIADGPNTEQGELALGRNVLVAFMPWNGYNFEDAIMISEKVVKEDIYTSIHIDEFEIGARDTKLGPEEITRDIPNVSEEALRNLGSDGVIRVGAEVKPGDILVGKITPKSETELAPEERLLRAIFGEKAADVKDTSLTVPSGTYGIVMDVKVSSRREIAREKLTPAETKRQLKSITEDNRKKKEELTEQLTDALSNVLLGEKIPLDVVNAQTGEIIIPANRKITKTLLRKLAVAYDHIEIDPSPIRNKIREIISQYEHKFAELELERERSMDRVESGDDVDPGIIKQVKVFVASKRKLSVGDKMAGRHGNKGVVARIVPEEDMPYLPDGTPVEICLNPLGVPSRMNVGQVLETHLGVAAKALGFKVATPVFDGISEAKIREYLNDAQKVDGFNWVQENGKARLFDGRTGDPFDQEVVVGYIYMLKLGHLVADKIHARAVGPYSLVTQQPLGGKAQYGGQRFGEMEVWALEAYGAAYTLQELLTVKSDDVQGRTRIYESIVKGDNSLEAGTPESFNVLIKEMQSLGLDVKVGGQAPSFLENVA
ncbi:MAG: DNA-directed RNA polymerase subunit beta [Chthoniobacterales bacterium]